MSTPRRDCRAALADAASRSAGELADLGYAAGWRLVRAMPEFAARNAFDAGALYASRGGGPEQLRKNLARVHRGAARRGARRA